MSVTAEQVNKWTTELKIIERSMGIMDAWIKPRLKKVISEMEQVTEPATERFCSNCGSQLSSGSKFCSNCGKSL